MTAGTYDFTIEVGTDVVLPLEYEDAAGNPIDLTGCSAALMIRRSYDSADTLVSLSSDGNGIVIDPAAGILLASIDASVTSTFTVGNAVYDLKLIDSLGRPQRLIQGSINISPAVTR